MAADNLQFRYDLYVSQLERADDIRLSTLRIFDDDEEQVFLIHIG
jgi:hypothetical protein